MDLNSFENGRIQVSVIIPIYNAEKYLDACLESIIVQDSESIEVICIDDGSFDRSYMIMLSYKEKLNNMLIIRQPYNKGLSVARNIGLSKDRGEYIIFVDSDDFVKAGFIKSAFCLCREKSLDMLLFSFMNFTEEKAMIERYSNKLESKNEHIPLIK